MYVFDTSPFSTLFKNYYQSRFPSLWSKFDLLIASQDIVSTREVLRELSDGPSAVAVQWSILHKEVFAVPSASEGEFVAKIFTERHFQQNIEMRKVLKGGFNADAFVVAKAACESKTVVTIEQLKPNAAKLPNICAHFSIPCISLEDFMVQQNWIF